MGRRVTRYDSNDVLTDEKQTVEDEPLFEEPVVKETPKSVKPKKKTYADTDLIPCVSITMGKLHFEGAKSKEFYHWIDIGDVVEVEYRDLVSAIRNNSIFIFEPRFIIQDDDFLNIFDNVKNRYGELYTPADIERVLQMEPRQLEAYLKKMPVGAQNAVRDLAVRKVDNGELDSINRIKVIDSFFGTELSLKLIQ